ncbi:MAG: hypothetical protein J1G07_01875 [Clostridiales bacterium]|nr:hypothetical protein [Clostridiales bacterium]
MGKFKLKKCPFCNSDLIYSNSNQNEEINTTSEEHIIPKSLGNDILVLKKGIVCDKCNNYFALNIEKPFLEMEPIKLIRAYHLIESRKKKVPQFDVLLGNETAIMHFDKNSNAFHLEVSPEMVAKLYNGYKPSYLISKGISIEELKNNYNVSRLLVKIFIELYLYYDFELMRLDENIDDDFYFTLDKKMQELVNYVRYGKKGKIYDYEVYQTKEIIPYSNDDFIANVEFTHDADTLTGITLNLFELQFVLKL